MHSSGKYITNNRYNIAYALIRHYGVIRTEVIQETSSEARLQSHEMTVVQANNDRIAKQVNLFPAKINVLVL